jgi:CRP/FNR family transcriptional regulator, nitrogen fixation regulation protein
MADGRRQILDFLLPGDFFGFVRGYEHHFCVVEVMIEGTAVARYSRRRLEMLAATDPQVAARVREIAFETISRAYPWANDRAGEGRLVPSRDGGPSI